MSNIPGCVDELTAEWFTRAMREYGSLAAAESVTDISVEPVGADLGYLSFLYRVRPTYSADSPELPETLVVKLPSTDAGGRLTGNGLRAYERESLFYKYCGDSSPCAPPAHYYSHSDPAADEYILVMEDLAGCRFVNQTDGVQPADAINCFKALAAQHAMYWEKSDELAWAPPFSEYGQLYKPLLDSGAPLIAQNWGDRLHPTYVDHVDKALASYAAIADRLQTLPTTLIHCDPRIENIAFDGEKPRFYDWQLVSRGPAAYDLMYFFKQSMDVDVRRECQDEMFDVYLGVLADGGVDYSRQQLMDDMAWACGTIWGFLAMIGNFFVRNAVNEKLMEMTLPRFMAMVEDFGAVEKLSQV